jgi:hypothetical protein
MSPTAERSELISPLTVAEARLSRGEKIAGVSAILLFVLMFFRWFGVEATEKTSLLMIYQRFLPAKSAWEALDYIPIILLIAIIAALAVAALRLTHAIRRPPVQVNAVVGTRLLALRNPVRIGPGQCSSSTPDSLVSDLARGRGGRNLTLRSCSPRGRE